MGIVGTPIAPDVSQPMVWTKDIAAVAAKRLSALGMKGHSIEYILGERNLSYTEVTRALGKALGKEDLQYVQFPYEDARKAMVQMGLSEDVADLLVQLAKAINSGDILSHYERTPDNTTQTSIEEFAKAFAEAFNAMK
jgi:nucleoside-diphosphate-sugar epimerase